MRHRSDRLDRLSQSHLIPEQNPLLGQNISGPEHLIRPQVPVKFPEIKVIGVNLFGQFHRYAAVDCSAIRSRSCQLLNEGVVGRAVLFEIVQGLRFTHALGVSEPGNQFFDETVLRPAAVFQKFFDRPDRFLLRLPAGKDPVEAAAYDHRCRCLLDKGMDIVSNGLRFLPDRRAVSVSGNLCDQEPALPVAVLYGQAYTRPPGKVCQKLVYYIPDRSDLLVADPFCRSKFPILRVVDIQQILKARVLKSADPDAGFGIFQLLNRNIAKRLRGPALHCLPAASRKLFLPRLYCNTDPLKFPVQGFHAADQRVYFVKIRHHPVCHFHSCCLSGYLPSRDSYRAMQSGSPPVSPTLSRAFRNCSRDQWKFRLWAGIFPKLQYTWGPSARQGLS